MNRWGFLTPILGLAPALLILQGCGGLLAGPAFPRRDFAPAPASREAMAGEARGELGGLRLASAPVADLSSGGIRVRRAFVGAGVARMQPPANSTLQESTVLDLSVGYEVWPTLSLKLLYGMWDIADRPNSSWSATNELQMRPIMLLAQFAWNPKGASGRWYAGIGGGYSVATSYQVSGRYESLLGSSYEVEADNSWVWQAVAGGEVFGSSDLKINIGFELGYAATITDIEWTRTLDGVVSSDSGGLMFYFFRTYLSLPF